MEARTVGEWNVDTRQCVSGAQVGETDACNDPVISAKVTRHTKVFAYRVNTNNTGNVHIT
jgi:hypothetical protein